MNPNVHSLPPRYCEVCGDRVEPDAHFMWRFLPTGEWEHIPCHPSSGIVESLDELDRLMEEAS